MRVMLRGNCLHICMHSILFVSVLLFSLLSLNPAEASITQVGSDQVEIIHVDRKISSRYAYAAKLSWDSSKRVWRRVIMVYNQSPEPEVNHPAWRYVNSLKIPQFYGRYHEDLHYKPFYLKANCSGKTPLSFGRPWVLNFDHLSKGQYSNADVSKDWNCPERNQGNHLVDIVEGEEAFNGQSLKIQFPKGSSGCSAYSDCISWLPNIGGKFERLYYGFRVKFPENFDFVKGGKLLGLGSADVKHEGKKSKDSSSWTVRTMWDKKGKLVQYVHYPNQLRKYGDVYKWKMDEPLSKNQWHTIQTLVTLNKEGESNGTIQTWLDGRKVLNVQGFRFRENKEQAIDHFVFSSFFGGNGPFWAPKSDQYAYIDDVVLSEQAPFFRERSK